MAQQLTFDLPAETALGRGDFFVSPSNAVAVDTIQTWHDWPQGKLLLIGPEGSGKTHLAHVWAGMTGAMIIAAKDLPQAEISALAASAVVVENADEIAGNAEAEQALFHLHNLAQSNRSALLLTAQKLPARWNLSLPDLQSRIQGSAMVSIQPPDDELLAAVLIKLFADRQLAVEADLVSYLISRMERSFVGASRTVTALDHAALTQKRRMNRTLAGEVLDDLGQDQNGPDEKDQAAS